MQKTKSGISINCLYRMKFRVTSDRVASRRENLQASKLLGCEVYRKGIMRWNKSSLLS